MSGARAAVPARRGRARADGGDPFLVEQAGGEWVHGRAYGGISRRGRVMDGWSC
ncbi:hypothetical protein [Streptomyces sp. NPDC005012]|uniref:hypothetical protein n=1 Tax=Streptomyces sp. NPDC005012 TaxID=3154558 RepID=UPI0033A33F81